MMELVMLSEVLKKGLADVGRVIPSRSSMTVTSCVLVEADKETGVTLTGTDLSLRVELRLGARVENPGALVVPLANFGAFVGMLPVDQVQLEADEMMKLDLMCGEVQGTFRGLEAEEYPARTVVDEDALAVHVEVDDLRLAIQRVTFAASKDESHRVLTGVLLEAEGEWLTLSAADGFRLARQRVPLMSALAHRAAVIVPSKALAEVGRLLPGGDVPIQIGFMEHGNGYTQLVVDMGDVVATVQLIDGNFPDIARIIPETVATTLETGREGLLQAAKRAGIFARDSANIVELDVGVEGRQLPLYVYAESSESGEGMTGMGGRVKGEGLKIAVNVRFFVEVLGALGPEDRVVLGFNGPQSPITVEIPGDDAFVYVVMPMHLGR